MKGEKSTYLAGRGDPWIKVHGMGSWSKASPWSFFCLIYMNGIKAL